MILFNIQVANSAYTKKNADNEATLSMMTRVVDKIESLEGYKAGTTPVVFIGEPNDYLKSYVYYGELETLTGLNNNSAITYYGTYSNYFKQIMRADINIIEEDEALEQVAAAEIDSMNTFPSTGSIAVKNGIVVVKFDEISEE